ncbi:MAG TPA: T9SS type A sorting domain-containing protein [Bacteroidia bacterium]
MKKALLILFVIASIAKQSKGQTWVSIQDANFVAYLQSIIPAAMNGNQMDTTSALVTTTTHSINVSGNLYNIVNFFGLQYFKSLAWFDCSSSNFNSITLIFPAFPKTLAYLDCSWNKILTLPNLPTSLTYLDCDNSQINTITNLPDSLQTLICNNNSIACFPSFPNSITTLNISSNTYNCLPNYITAMSAANLATPLCAAGNSNGCAVAGIQQVAGINEQVTVYPNPASSSLQVTFSGNIGQVTGSNNQVTLLITDMLGNTVKQVSIKSNQVSINVVDLNEGVYTISISSNVGVVNKRVVIVR